MVSAWLSSIVLLALLGASAPDHAESVGHPFTGKLVSGVRLTRGEPNYKLRRSTAARGWNYGTSALVRGIRRVAEELAVADRGAAPLVVGNLSRRGGGDLPCSRSHNTGRDVDFGLYTTDKKGRSVPSRYYRFGENGRSLEAGGRYRFDVRRNWNLIRELLSSPHFEVSTLVLNPHLERLVLAHARAAGESAALIERAERLIDLPRYANLHRNHLHVRIACPKGHARCVD